MEETEKHFRCPHCREKISMILDLSVDGHQTYIEDCEVCCRPIQISYITENGQITAFRADAS
jgi:transcription elongation factor Elf1